MVNVFLKVFAVILLALFVIPAFFFSVDLIAPLSDAAGDIGNCDPAAIEAVGCQNYEGELTSAILVIFLISMPFIIFGIFILFHFIGRD